MPRQFRRKTVKNDGKTPFPSLLHKNVYDALIDDPRAKYEQLEKTLGVSESSIQRSIKWMKQNGYIASAHAKIKGVWQILDCLLAVSAKDLS